MGEEWKGLRQGGPNGFFVVILAFSWWVKAMDGKVDDMGLHDALDDLTWVVKCMADVPATPDQSIGGKRAQEDLNEPDTSIKKRYALSFPITSQANGANATGGKQSELKSGREIVVTGRHQLRTVYPTRTHDLALYGCTYILVSYILCVTHILIGR